MKRIHKVAVLGAGTMGARIAAHFANAGVPSYLLDIVPPDADGPARNKIAAAGLEAAKKSKPAAFFEPGLARLVTVGNFEDDLKRLSEVDWIIEAVVENLEIKRALLKKVEAMRKPGTIITTNTSGLPVGKDRRRLLRRFPQVVVRHAFFQSAALYAAAGDYSHAGSGPRRHRGRCPLQRRESRQGRGVRERHAQLHRQSHRHVFRAQRDAPHAGDGPEHRRRGRADRRCRGMAELRHVPHH